MKEFLIPVFSLIASLVFVILFIALGWYIVWTLFLKRFKFVRELLNGNDEEKEKPKKVRAKTRRD